MRVTGPQIWRAALSNWDEITAPDLHEFYGLDDEDPAFWARSWRSTLHRIRGLLARPESRLAMRLAPPPKKK